MSIIKWFNKPKWQSPNEKVRMTAIQTSQDPELTGQLLTIVFEDVSEKVQLAALNKISNPTDINHIVNTHQSKKIKSVAKRKLVACINADKDDQYQDLFQHINDKEVIQAIAQDAKNTSIKIKAIAQITQQGFLGDLLLKERDPAVQSAILQHISQPSTLQRLMEKTKKNKALRKQLEQRLGTSNDKQLEQKAIELCQKLDSVVHGKNSKDIDLAAINQQWTNLESTVPENLKLRFAGAYEAARMILDPDHRTEFLQKQKKQRTIIQLNEIESSIEHNQLNSLMKIQQAIESLNELDVSSIDPKDQAKHQRINQALLALREQIQQDQKIPDHVFKVVDDINDALSKPTATPQQLRQFKSQWQKATKNTKNSEAFSHLNEQFNNLCTKLAEKIDQSAMKRDQAADKAVALIDQAIQLIEDGQLAQAKVVSNEIASLKKLAGFSHPVIKQNKYHLDQVWSRLKELRNWQKWSNDKARQEIINSVAAMHGQGLHPDAVLKKLKDSNAQWYALEDMEKLEGDKYPSRNQALWQEFRNVSKAVFEPTQPFFEKRSEVQNDRLETINQLINEMDSCDLDNTAERDLARITRDGFKELKALDQLPPKQRGKMAKRLRKSINRIDQKLNEFYQIAESKKMKLIEQAQALQELDDINEAIESAKNLQHQWKSAGIVKQYTERKLWKKFRKANDALFNQRNQVKEEFNSAQQEQKELVKNFITKQQKNLKSNKDIESLAAFKADTLKAWDTLEKPGQFMQAELNQLIQQIDEKIHKIKNKAVTDELKLKEKIDQIYSQFEQGEIDQTSLNDKLAGTKNDNLLAWFNQRATAESNADSLNQHLIAAEFLTGLSTPDQFMEQRMAYQVQILSERMSGEKGVQDNEHAKHLLDSWLLLPKSDASFIKDNKKRINQVIKGLKSLAFG
ncbi:DUF349 domain-containing protein [Marinicella litoralis]|uniref:Uncharacterized protein DUF349 n=1 Tax=Marinicella litoralis TaxID=644220 RepID=A0A4R6XEV7_9GAMM|nr:DUF349 domain-containing protein [Marinicella litoralis]TDR16280.1 uncharacterized protein DUF349 [Marinicella litoralis]